MKKSIFVKVFAGQLLVIISLTAFILIFSYSAVRGFSLHMQERDLESLAISLRHEVVEHLESGQLSELNDFVRNLGSEIETRITVIDRKGIVLADSEEDPNSMENHRARPEIYKAYGGETGKSLRFSRTLQTEMLYVGIPVRREGEVTEVLRVSLYLRDIQSLIRSLRNRIIPIVLAVLALSLVIAYISNRSLSRPVRELADASRKIAGGDFSTRVRFRKKNELTMLADNFNLMTERISDLFNDIKQKKLDLDAVLSSMPEGLISVDWDDRILLANKSFFAISGVRDCLGKRYWEIIRDPGIMDMVKKSKSEEKNIVGEINLKETDYLCSVNYQEGRRELVITLHNISEAKKLAAMKKDLIANASHELRTPLTSIKGYIDTLEDHVDHEGRNYLTVLKKNADRLSSIVADLMALSELESLNRPAQAEELDIAQLLKDVLKLFEQKIKVKGLEVHWDIKVESPRIKGESFRLEQMFANLLDNAVKYTDKGSINIAVDREESEQGKISVSIGDTGNGIAPEHINRIFERFYVTDRARTRKTGGTGLGLSIVKHIAKLHGGEVSVRSTPGKGTVFTVLLPVSPGD